MATYSDICFYTSAVTAEFKTLFAHIPGEELCWWVFVQVTVSRADSYRPSINAVGMEVKLFNNNCFSPFITDTFFSHTIYLDYSFYSFFLFFTIPISPVALILISTASFTGFSKFCGEGFGRDTLLRAMCAKVSFFLSHNVWLWVSVFVPICFMRKHLWW